MSSEIHKHIEEALDKKENLFNARVINFPNEVKINNSNNSKSKDSNFWRISDKSNSDQLKAVIGICFMFGTLNVMALYSAH